ncbi:restriction endonuclease [bacterium]|nr:restriction endonuclease [bacterium]
MADNTLYYGDNLDVLKRYVKDESVDLVYLDPPFKSNQDYNILFAEQNGTRSAAQIKAFEDTWHWDQDSARTYEETVETASEPVSRALQAFRKFLGDNDVLAYLTMMAPRLIELRRVLKETGTIYLHCDPTASHYLKMLMDAVFGPRNFRNEIIWRYRRWPSRQHNFQRMHDTILRYAKGESVIWNQLYDPLSEETRKRIKGGKRIATTYDEHGKKRIRPTKEDSQGVAMCDVWEIRQIVGPTAERLGYPTQKPEKLLERIINSSSNKGDLVLDPFCGCGTAIAVAQRLKRRWIGIDVTHLAVSLVKHRLHNAFGSKATYDVIGEPADLESARVLAKDDPFQFQFWALGLVGARPADPKKGADKGIDGRLYFHFEGTKTKQVIISVKSGNVGVSDIRDLRGVIEREKAELGVYISLNEHTKAMRTEAASAGFYKVANLRYPKLQLFTIEELLRGKCISYPGKHGDATIKKAPRANNPNDTENLPLN